MEEYEITPEVERDWPGISEKREARKYHEKIFELRRGEIKKIEEFEAACGRNILIMPVQNIAYNN